MATQTKLVKLADDRVIRLTVGEINAIEAYVKMNGKDGNGADRIQYDPGTVKFTTIRNLVGKGVLERVGMGLVRFPEGVLDITVLDD